MSDCLNRTLMRMQIPWKLTQFVMIKIFSLWEPTYRNRNCKFYVQILCTQCLRSRFDCEKGAHAGHNNNLIVALCRSAELATFSPNCV